MDDGRLKNCEFEGWPTEIRGHPALGHGTDQDSSIWNIEYWKPSRRCTSTEVFSLSVTQSPPSAFVAHSADFRVDI